MMKKAIITALCALAFVGCTQQPADGMFTLNGTVAEGGEGKTVYLATFDGGFQVSKVDSTTIQDGKFTFTDSMDAPIQNWILVDTWPMSMDCQNYSQLYLEATTMTLEISSLDSLTKAKLTGSATQDEVNDYQATMESVSKPLDALNKQFYEVRASGDTIALAKVEAQMDSIRPIYEETQQKWMDAHPQAYMTFQLKSFGMGYMTLASVDSLFSAMPAKFQGTDVYNRINEELTALKKSAPGAPAPDFADKDINGQDFKLSSLKGHYVILDFWASWCVPCRQSMPHVMALYKKYKDKGLEVVCVSDDDSDHDKWKAAVEKDGTGEFHHVLRGLKVLKNGGFDKSEDKSDSYAVHYLPTKFLIDPDMKIVDKVDDEQLEAKLKEAYGF